MRRKLYRECIKTGLLAVHSAHTIPALERVEADGADIQGHPCPHSKSETNLVT